MRTTVTFDPDVAAQIRKRMAETDLSFKETVNQAVRQGLKAPEKLRKRKFKVRPFSLAFRPGVDPNRLNQLVDELEAEEYLRKMNK